MNKNAILYFYNQRKRKDFIMYQIKVNGILMPTIYWSLREAIEACQREAERGCAVMTDIISVEQ